MPLGRPDDGGWRLWLLLRIAVEKMAGRERSWTGWLWAKWARRTLGTTAGWGWSSGIGGNGVGADAEVGAGRGCAMAAAVAVVGRKTVGRIGCRTGIPWDVAAECTEDLRWVDPVG